MEILKHEDNIFLENYSLSPPVIALIFMPGSSLFFGVFAPNPA
jgi:hypothetical protein